MIPKSLSLTDRVDFTYFQMTRKQNKVLKNMAM